MQIGDNAAKQLLGFVEEAERINEQIKDLQEQRKTIFHAAMGAGFDAKAIRRIIRERAMDREDLDEFDQLVAVYWGALGR